MSEVWYVAHEIAWLIGWIVIGALLIAAYVKVGLWVVKSVQILNVASPETRLALAIVWPLVMIGRLLALFMRTAARLIVRLYVLAIETATGEGVPVVRAPEPLRPSARNVKAAPVAPYRSEEDKDLAELENIESQERALKKRKRELITRLEARQTPRSKLVHHPRDESN